MMKAQKRLHCLINRGFDELEDSASEGASVTPAKITKGVGVG